MHFKTYNGLKFCLGKFDECCKNKEIVKHRIFKNTYIKIELQNIRARHSWKKHVVCFHKLDYQRSFRLKQSIRLVI